MLAIRIRWQMAPKEADVDGPADAKRLLILISIALVDVVCDVVCDNDAQRDAKSSSKNKGGAWGQRRGGGVLGARGLVRAPGRTSRR